MPGKKETVYIVIDDDPTGGQTVHDVPVLMRWDQDMLKACLKKAPRLIYIMTNSRSLSQADTIALHHGLMKQLMKASGETMTHISIISRGDSTLRGHFPAETDVIGSYLSDHAKTVLIPCFPEGQRYTKGDIHYLVSGGRMVPVGQSEFARDKTFGFRNSDLKKYIEEKTGGKVKAGEVGSISLTLLDGRHDEEICRILNDSRYKAVIVNGMNYEHLRCFKKAYEQLEEKERFVMRTASSWPKVIGEIRDIPLLKGTDLCEGDREHGGLIIAGSHVRKSSGQLNRLRQRFPWLQYLEFNQHLVLNAHDFQREIARVSEEANTAVRQGKTAVIYTRRDRLDLGKEDPMAELEITRRIAGGVTKIAEEIRVRPRYVVTKGGITSSDIITKAFRAGTARILGQAAEGIPVWRLGEDSLYPGMAVVIFPGNVGDEDTLADLIESMEG